MFIDQIITNLRKMSWEQSGTFDSYYAQKRNEQSR